MKKLFTCEMVCEGHPDKLCDKIADTILDDYLLHDEDSRVAVEVAVSYRRVFIFGEVTSKYKCDVESIARRVICEVGYDNDKLGFNGNNVEIIVDINKQSLDIARGIDQENDIGASDQGIVFGYATDETEEYLPLCYVLTSKLARRVKEVRENNILPYLRPDGKMQVTVEYRDNIPYRVDTVVISLQHDDIDIEMLKRDVKREIIEYVIDKELLIDTKYLINPTGRFVIGGPVGDTGLTGRKIVIDTYSGYSRHGGGAFSGKDYTKVDRSAAYYARYVCKNLVASGICKKCMLEVGYAIGISKAVSLNINTFDTGIISDDEILDIINKEFDFSPYNIISKLGMKKMCYSELSNYGHFGRETSSFEKLDMLDKLKKYVAN